MQGFFDKPELPCCVCGDELPAEHFAECMSCLQPYHMRMTESERDARDCGMSYLDDEDYFVVFVCKNCFEGREVGQPAR